MSSTPDLPAKVEKTAAYLGGVLRYCLENNLSPEVACDMLKVAGEQFSQHNFGDNIFDQVANYMGMAKQADAMGGSQNLNLNRFMPKGGQAAQKQQGQQAGGASSGGDKGPAHSFDFINDPNVKMMMNRQEDLKKQLATTETPKKM